MDNLAGLLDAPRARGAFTLRTVMSPPWSLRILTDSPLTLIAGIQGDIWVVPDDGEACRIGAGDIVVMRSPVHYTVADAPGTPPQVIIHPGQRCTSPDGVSLTEQMMHGVRTWGNDPEGSTVFLVGAYENLSDVSNRLLRALPPLLSVLQTEWESPLVTLLSDEMIKDVPGQAAVLDRLLDLLLTAVLRAWFGGRDSSRPDWWRTQSDPVVERALRIMHDDPAHPWTVELLADRAGTSRSSLARRFQDLVGEPPMTFLKHWRLAMAADLLCEPGQTVGTVAVKVGYTSQYAFSSAFKRVRGISPKQHRMQAITAS
jgi:AraC-like DNA-binding protein